MAAVMGLGRVELPTSRLSGVRSNHLSYRPCTTKVSAPRPLHPARSRRRTLPRDRRRRHRTRHRHRRRPHPPRRRCRRTQSRLRILPRPHRTADGASRHESTPPGPALSSSEVERSAGLRRVRDPGGCPGCLLAVHRREHPLAEPDVLRRDFDQLVLLDVLEAVLEGDGSRRLQLDILVGGRRPHVAELLFLGDVDVHVTGAGILSHHHALVHLLSRGDEHLGPLLEVAQREPDHRALPVGHQHSPLPARQRPGPGPVGQEPMMHGPGAPGVGQKLRAVSEEPATRNLEDQPDQPHAGIPHFGHLGAAGPQLFHHRTHVVLGHVDHQFLVRLQPLPGVAHPGDDPGADTWNSNPSRRMVSIRMPRCSSPRPETVWVSGLSVSSTRSATFRSSSRYSRSLSWRLVTYFPSRPAKGPLFTMTSTEIVGSSTAMPASRSGRSTEVNVRPISRVSNPESATLSPARASCTSTRWSPSKVYSLVTRFRSKL